MAMLENAADRSFESFESFELRLLKDFQRNFPLCPAPFAELAARLGVGEAAVLRRLEQLRREGTIARVGAVFAPKLIGASTLAAMAVPRERITAISAALARFPEVNHIDVRAHRYALWFVVTAGSEGRLQAALGAIAQATGLPVMPLPLLGEYRAGAGDERAQRDPRVSSFSGSPTLLDEIGRRLVMALQEGLPLFIRPFSILASRVGCDEAEVLERIRRWCAQGVIKRFGVVLRHPAVGGAADALLVHDVPDADLERVGERLAQAAAGLFWYRRARVIPDWPYNLYCSVHGERRDEVLARIEELRARLGLGDYACDVLFMEATPASANSVY
jgi:DNA-binding Lrp family transcriptional regulator